MTDTSMIFVLLFIERSVKPIHRFLAWVGSSLILEMGQD